MNGGNDDLPESLRDIAEALGLRVALAFAAAFGGTELRIPKRLPPPDHPLMRALGPEDCAALCRYMADQVVYVPHCRVEGRRRAVVQLLSQGATQAQVARRTGLSARHVRRIAAAQPAAMDDLFSRLTG